MENNENVGTSVSMEDDIKNLLMRALDNCKDWHKTGPNRQLSLVITKIEESLLWLTQVGANARM